MAAFAGPTVRIRLPPAAGRQRTRFSRSQYYSWQIIYTPPFCRSAPPNRWGERDLRDPTQDVRSPLIMFKLQNGYRWPESRHRPRPDMPLHCFEAFGKARPRLSAGRFHRPLRPTGGTSRRRSTCRSSGLQQGMQPIDTIVHEYNDGLGRQRAEPRAHVLRQEYRSIPLGVLGSKRDSAPATRLHTAGLLGPAVPGWVMADCRMWTNLVPFAYGSPHSAPQHQPAWGGWPPNTENCAEAPRLPDPRQHLRRIGETP
jgi:hypothetical protein